MSSDGGDYDVGYGKPPREHQFQKGHASPHKGKTRAKRVIDIGAILRAPVEIKVGGKRVKRDEFEVRLRSLVESAVRGDFRAARDVLKIAERAGLIPVLDEEESGCGIVIRVPKDWDYDEWLANYKKYGIPPWPTERDGLIPPERCGPSNG